MFNKSFFFSKTLWGIAVMLLGFYMPIPEDLKQSLPSMLSDAFGQIMTGIGTLLAIYGRLHATNTLTLLPWRKPEN